MEGKYVKCPICEENIHNDYLIKHLEKEHPQPQNNQKIMEAEQPQIPQQEARVIYENELKTPYMPSSEAVFEDYTELKPSKAQNVLFALFFLILVALLGSSASLVYKGVQTEGQLILYLTLGLFGAMFILMIETAMIILNRGLIWNKIRLFIGKARGYGKVRILYPNSHFREYMKKFSPEGFRIKDVHYRFEPKRISKDIDGNAIIYYRYGDTEPIDLIEDEIPLVDGKLYAQDLDKAMSAGALSVQRSGMDTKEMLLLAGAIGAIIGAVLIFRVHTNVQDLLALIG